jgi:HEAT repeat protein
MMAIGQLGPPAAERAHIALVGCLSSESPTVRRAAVRTIGHLRDVAAMDSIAGLLSDNTPDPGAWFDDDCTVAQAAEVVLRELTAPALALAN